MRTPDGLLARESFTPERVQWWQQEIAKVGDAMPFLSPEERETSRRETLAHHPPGADLWVFGYGSLMWNPAIHVAESRVGTVDGLCRAFCLALHLGRATPERPGLMLALDEGGSCTGIAHRIAAEHVESETAILWMREMLSGAYLPRWITVATASGPLHAFTFVINRAHPRYTGVLPEPETVTRLATAEGVLGTNRDYLYRTAGHLAELGIEDPLISRLAPLVRAAAGESPP